jgi:hypothetical protein
MAWVRRATLLATLSLTLAVATGCARQATIQATAANSATPQQAPFGRVSPRLGPSPTAALEPANVPMGTLVSIRVQSVVSSASAQTGDAFDATLDQPLVLQGELLAPSGSAVNGRIVSAKSSSGQDDPGYLRLTLTSISIHGKKLLLQTSSLFAKASSFRSAHSVPAMALMGTVTPVTLGGAANTANVEIGPDRTLTFRLTRAVPLDSVSTPMTSK